MSLEDTPAPTLKQMKGRLEAIETNWTMAINKAARKKVDEDFKNLADEIRRRFGADGAKAVDEVLAKHKALNFAR